MKIFAIIGSQRPHGKSTEIINFLQSKKEKHDIEYVHLGEKTYNSCVQCFRCSNDAKCHIQDNFNDEILNKIKETDILIITSPLFSFVPSKLAAVLERLTSISYFYEDKTGNKRPLKDKNCAVVCYNSQKVHYSLENEIKSIMKQIVATSRSPYKFLNDKNTITKAHADVIEYLEEIFTGPIENLEGK